MRTSMVTNNEDGLGADWCCEHTC